MTNLDRAFQLEDQGQPQAAEQCYLSMLNVEPNNPVLLHNLGRLYQRYGKVDHAAAVFSQLLNVADDPREAHRITAHLAMDRGNVQAAVDHFKACGGGSDMLFAACHLEDKAAADQLHYEWSRRFAIIPKPKAGLGRVGFLSAHFKQHTVPKFALPVISNQHYLYSDVAKPDEVTETIRAHGGNWRDISKQTDDEVRRQLEVDAVDTIIDLGGHLNGSRRAELFATLPFSLSYVGYPRSTGIVQQWRVTDSVIDPQATAERLLKVPNGAYGYQGDEGWAVAEPTTGAPIFGSINRPCKFTAPMLDAWARIIRETGGSLRVLTPGGEQSRQLRDRIVSHGIAGERLALLPTGDGEHYRRFVVGCSAILDAWTYSGMTTVADALWLGVPVVAYRGDQPQGRVAASLLTSAGLREWIGETPEDYVAAAVVGTDLRGADLREQIRKSPLGDGSIAERFAAAIKTLDDPKPSGCGHCQRKAKEKSLAK